MHQHMHTHTHTTHTHPPRTHAHPHPLTHPPTHTTPPPPPPTHTHTHTHTYPPTHTGDPPFSSPAPIPGWTGTYIAREGERVQLDCPSPSPSPSSSSSSSSSSSLLSLSHTHSLWMKKGGRVASNGMGVWQNENGTLVLLNVTPEVGGTYWCVVWNEGYVAIETITLFING